MAHKIEKIYQETCESWAVICSCGWKEKALSENLVRGRFDSHKKMPHKK